MSGSPMSRARVLVRVARAGESRALADDMAARSRLAEASDRTAQARDQAARAARVPAAAAGQLAALRARAPALAMAQSDLAAAERRAAEEASQAHLLLLDAHARTRSRERLLERRADAARAEMLAAEQREADDRPRRYHREAE